MGLTEYQLKVLSYFYEHFNNYTLVKDAPAVIAGTGYRKEFRECVFQLFTSKLLEKEVSRNFIKLLDDKYRISRKGKEEILKGKTDLQIKHLILGFLKTTSEQFLRLDEVEEAIPIERDRICYLLDELEEDKNIIIKRIAESDNSFIMIEGKGVRSYLKSEYLKPVDKTADTTSFLINASPPPTQNFITMVKYNKPRVFIGSSVEGKNIADAINENLEHEAWCSVWAHTFVASGVTIDSLIRNCTTYDFAIFIFSPDDISEMRKTTLSVARDNVIFETGLFMGEFGKDRVFIVQPRDIPNFRVLTDLSGFTTVTYDSERASRKEEVRSAVTTAATEIKKGIENSTWSTLQLKIKAGIRAESSNVYEYPLTIQLEIKNKHHYPVTLQSIDFELGDKLRFALNSNEEQHKPIFLSGKEQVTLENGEQVSCWLPIDPTISEEVLRNEIEGNRAGRWTFRCIWIKDHVTVCKYEVKF